MHWHTSPRMQRQGRQRNQEVGLEHIIITYPPVDMLPINVVFTKKLVQRYDKDQGKYTLPFVRAAAGNEIAPHFTCQNSNFAFPGAFSLNSWPWLGVFILIKGSLNEESDYQGDEARDTRQKVR